MLPYMERSDKYRLVVGRVRALMTQRFWTHVQVPPLDSACWKWVGATEVGYAALNIPLSRQLRIGGHVFSFFLHHGRWPGPGKLVCHTRNCTSKECVNPEHLYEGTHQTNAQDREAVRAAA